MSHCLNPTCQQPTNPTGVKFCQTCGHQIFLQGRYYPLRLIGQGAFGRTLLAEDYQKPSQPRCVIKQFFPDPINMGAKAIALFHDEAVRLEQLGSHPQIPALYAHCEQAGYLYIVQEFIDGQTLAAELKERGAFPEAAIRELLLSLLPVLDFIHHHQIIHRDIKPDNIIRRRTDNQLVLVDFGAAKHATATALAKTGTTIGSAGYAAREQSFGKAVYASDLYSLGVTCLHLLTQVAPFDLYDSLEGTFIWRQFLNNNPINNALGTVLDRMVQEKVSERYPSATAILQALTPHPSSPAPPSAPPTPPSTPRTPNSAPRTPHSTPPTPLPSPALRSENGVDYSRLRDLLAKATQTNSVDAWKAADQETLKVMEKALGKEWSKWFSKDLLNFPCADLLTIDQLWVHYSNGHFGFSVQKEIYVKCGAKLDHNYPGDEILRRFCTQVGWYVKDPYISYPQELNPLSLWRNLTGKRDSYISYSQVTFNTSSPKGHLPVRDACGCQKFLTGVSMLRYIFSRIETCKVSY